MVRVTPTRIAVLGMAFIALTYGLARFVFGLFLPNIRLDLGFSASVAGLIGAVPFVSYIAAILVAPALTRCFGVRWAAVLTALCAAIGLGAIAGAGHVAVLAVGVALCGVSTGLSTPIMAAAVTHRVPLHLRDRVHAMINAATSVGIALGMPVVIFLGAAWRPGYIGFSGVAVAILVAAAIFLPDDGRAAPPRVPSAPLARIRRPQWTGIAWLSLLAGSMGLTSAIYWVFAPDFAVNGGGLAPGQSAWMWLGVGTGGLLGMVAGDLVNRFGTGTTHAGAMLVLAAGLALLASAPGSIAAAAVSAILFGAAYMTLTGIYLVASIQIMPSRPALGPVVPFIAVAAGQAAGSPLAGQAIAMASHAPAFLGFAVAGVAVATASLPLGKAAMRPSLP